MLRIAMNYHLRGGSGIGKERRLQNSTESVDASGDLGSDFYAELGDAIREDLKEYIQSTKETKNGTR